MPELPEVESVRRTLAPQLVGRRIERVALYAPRLRWELDVAGLTGHLTGSRVVGLRRRAKYLLVDLAPNGAAPGEVDDRPNVLAVHLGMTGWFGLVPEDAPKRPHDHASFRLDNGQALRFYDPRRFGALFSFAAADEAGHRLLCALGPEPLDSGAFDGDWLYARSRNVARAIKALLMDARCVVGVGNIYASEALYRAGIHPRLLAGRLSRPRAHLLAEAVRQTLQEAIEVGGTTLRDFRDAEGKRGSYAPRLQVYGRAGLACRGCNRPVSRLVLHGRSTYLCTRCQRR